MVLAESFMEIAVQKPIEKITIKETNEQINCSFVFFYVIKNTSNRLISLQLQSLGIIIVFNCKRKRSVHGI